MNRIALHCTALHCTALRALIAGRTATGIDWMWCGVVGASINQSINPYVCKFFANLKQDQSSKQDEQLDSAKAIAKDLYNFMASFSVKTQQNDMLVIPTNCIDKWSVRTCAVRCGAVRCG